MTERGWDRRDFLRAAGAVGLGSALPAWAGSAKATGVALGPETVRYGPDIEPIVRWIEEAPRTQIVEEAAGKLKGGMSYGQLMAGVFLAGIRNVKPRPVGFKFHTVLSLHSAHQIAMAGAPTEQLLPMFWALDTFKASQARDVEEGDWTLSAVDESAVPGPDRAEATFREAMDAWDEAKADVAAAGLCRAAGASAAMEPFWRYGLRDHRNIGHKAIFAMQCWRTLQTIGWDHAEPVLRSLTYGILDRQGDAEKAPVGPYVNNVERAAKIRAGWQAGRPDPAATVALLEVFRQADADGASEAVAKHLNDGIAPVSLWDAVLLGAHELLMRRPGIVALHAVTSANALHYCERHSADETTRKLALLQAAGWLPLFRGRANATDGPKIDAMPVADAPESAAEAAEKIFEAINRDRGQAAALAAGYFARGGSRDAYYAAARALIVRKGRDSHDYKFAAAADEEQALAVDSRWRGALAAAGVYNFPGLSSPDNRLIVRAAEALRA